MKFNREQVVMLLIIWAVCIILMLLQGCASGPPLTPEQQAMHEVDRREKYVLWHDACLGANLTIAAHFHSAERPPRCSHRVDVCIPPARQWDFYYLSEERIRSSDK